MKKMFPLVLLLIFVAGCALDIRTTGYLDRAGGAAVLAKGATFAVVENAQAVNPVFDKEVKGKIETMLTKRGYRTAAPEKADYILTYVYSMSPGRRSTTFTSYDPPRTEIVAVADGKGGVTTRAITTLGTGTAYPMISTEYTRQLIIKVADAVRLRENKKEHVVWVGETHSIDPSSDLRYDIDYLLVVTFRYLGQDTGKQVRVNMEIKDPEVLELRNGGRPPVR